MNRKERFLAAVRRQPVDRVPMFDFLFQQPMYQALIGRFPESYNARDAVDCALALNHDAVWVPFGGFSGYQPRFLTEDVYIDEWGTTYQKSPSSWPIDAPIDFPIKSREDLVNYQPPDPTLPGRDVEIRTALSMPNDELAITGGIGGPMSNAWMLLGYERIAISIYDNPQLVRDVFALSNEFSKEAARRAVEAGVHAMWISEDLGDSTRGFFRLNQFRDFVLPYFADLVEYVRGLGVPVLMHSCGRISAYLPDLIQTGISAIHPLQRTAGMDLRQVKQQFGERMCIIGNIDSSRTLPFGSPEDVAAEVREALDIAAPGWGYVLASDHSLHDGIPLDNILALSRTGTEYGQTVYQGNTEGHPS
jgi:uroporphyrinogen decarboxylase